MDTTISGSGNLTPVSQQTLAVEQPVTVTTVNYAAGDNVEEGTVIATAEDAQGGSIDYTAPYGHRLEHRCRILKNHLGGNAPEIKNTYTNRSPLGHYFLLPNEIFTLELSPGELSVYAYLIFCEDRETYQCWPSIGAH